MDAQNEVTEKETDNNQNINITRDDENASPDENTETAIDAQKP